MPGTSEIRPLSSEDHLIYPGSTVNYPENDPTHNLDAAESLDVWGFKDTSFNINERGNVVLSGNRYLLCGYEMPAILPWVRNQFQVPLDIHHVAMGTYPPLNIPEPRLPAALLAALQTIFKAKRLCLDPEERLRRGHGHTQAEMYALKYGSLTRIPDVVVFPENETEISQLIEITHQHQACLIPYGGGTNVSEALLCQEDEARPIISVDLRLINKILWIDPINHLACIEAGAVGRHLTAALAKYGFTIGHEPDSIEFSTLGGWIATHASGMKKNRYGNIEDLVLDIRALTPQGVVSGMHTVPRQSIGTNPLKWFLGSEGSLGIITQATVRIFPLPEVQRYGSILFPNMQTGIEFLYELMQHGNIPASIRLVDHIQLQLNFVLKPPSVGFNKLISNLQKFFITKIKGFSLDQMVGCTLVFEGSKSEVKHQERFVYKLAKKFKGFKGGAANGERGYMLTYGIAYIRDWILKHYLIAESFETSAPWTRINDILERVKKRVYKEHALRKLPGEPLLTARVTQIYPTGVCIYFYLAFYYQGVQHPSKVFQEIEAAARDEILAAGGSISHHHGIGKIRKAFMQRVLSKTALTWRVGAKKVLDPENIFATHNLED